MSKLQAIDADSNLTIAGKQKARAELTAETLKKRKAWLNTLQPLDDQIRQIDDCLMTRDALNDCHAEGALPPIRV